MGGMLREVCTRVRGSQDGSPLEGVREGADPHLMREAKTKHIENGNDENALVPWGSPFPHPLSTRILTAPQEAPYCSRVARHLMSVSLLNAEVDTPPLSVMVLGWGFGGRLGREGTP